MLRDPKNGLPAVEKKRKEDQASRLGFLNLKTLCQDLTPSDGRLCFVEDIVQVGR